MVTSTSLITADYKSLMEYEHSKKDWGTTSHLHADRVLPLLIQSGGNSLLDYGAGKGTLKNSPKMKNITVHEYDPAIPAISMAPDPCGFVVCMDVLEHIEPDCLFHVLEDLQRVVLNKGFLIISLTPAFLTLRDGRNAHLILKEVHWWEEVIGRYFKIDMLKPYGMKTGLQTPWRQGLYPYANVHIQISKLDI